MKILVKNRSGQDMSHMGPYLKSFLPYAQKRMGFNRPPTIFFDSDPQNAENVLGKTAYYNPETEEIVVFVDKRHPKDILRSLSHELVHHSQNCRGDLNADIAGETTPGYAQTNTHMRDMESEAYKYGNGLYFRDWEDSLKNGLEETNYKHITGDTHKMANYDQLKEEITAKVVAALTEKLKGDKDGDGDEDFADIMMSRRMASGESEEEAREASKKHNETNERKKRDTPRESPRREPEKLKMNEEEQLDEMHCSGKRHDDLKPGERCPMCGYVVMAEGEEELKEYSSSNWAYGDLGGYDSEEQMRAAQEREERDRREREAAEAAKKARTPGKTLEENKEVVEEAISNDEWYQSELFESLKKRWTK